MKSVGKTTLLLFLALALALPSLAAAASPVSFHRSVVWTYTTTTGQLPVLDSVAETSTMTGNSLSTVL